MALVGGLATARVVPLKRLQVLQQGGWLTLTTPEDGGYKDVPGFCASVSVEQVKELEYVLSPGRYVGLAETEDDFDFEERFAALKAEFEKQL